MGFLPSTKKIVINDNMSPAEQTVVLLATVTSVLINARKLVNKEEDEEFFFILNLGIARMWEIIEEYPTERKENYVNTRYKCGVVGKVIEEHFPDGMTLPLIIYTGHKICADLLMEVCNDRKRSMVTEVNSILTRLNDFIDPDGEAQEVHDNVEEMLNQVYKEIGFETNLRYLKKHRKLQRRINNHAKASSGGR